MKYADGPLEVIKPNTDYVVTIELGQGARGFLSAAGNLEEAVARLRRDGNLPPAFIEALEKLQRVGGEASWDWSKITRRSGE